jgi:putative membrane protein
MRELGAPLALVAAGGLYGWFVPRRWREHGSGWAEPAAFLSGLAVVAVALLSPLDGASHRSLWVHMVQHLLLISVAAPLLAAGRPLAVVPATWSRPVRRRLGGWTVVAVAAAVQVAVLLAWHVPALYDAALGDDAVHGIEHLSLLLSAVALWMALDAVGGEQGGLAVVVLFVVSFPPLVLGFAMTFATTVWYRPYRAAGPSALTDQQVAGAVMWGYGGLAAVVGGVLVFVRWLLQIERANAARPPLPRPDTPVTSC